MNTAVCLLGLIWFLLPEDKNSRPDRTGHPARSEQPVKRRPREPGETSARPKSLALKPQSDALRFPHPHRFLKFAHTSDNPPHKQQRNLLRRTSAARFAIIRGAAPSQDGYNRRSR